MAGLDLWAEKQNEVYQYIINMFALFNVLVGMQWFADCLSRSPFQKANSFLTHAQVGGMMFIQSGRRQFYRV